MNDKDYLLQKFIRKSEENSDKVKTLSEISISHQKATKELQEGLEDHETHISNLYDNVDTLNKSKLNSDDKRLSDAREALPHKHPIDDIIGLKDTLGGLKLDTKKQIDSRFSDINKNISSHISPLVEKESKEFHKSIAGLNQKVTGVTNILSEHISEFNKFKSQPISQPQNIINHNIDLQEISDIKKAIQDLSNTQPKIDFKEIEDNLFEKLSKNIKTTEQITFVTRNGIQRLNQLKDVDPGVDDAPVGYVLTFDGNIWYAAPGSGGGGVSSLNGLVGDLSITSTGGSISITPSGSTIDLEVLSISPGVIIGTPTHIPYYDSSTGEMVDDVNFLRDNANGGSTTIRATDGTTTNTLLIPNTAGLGLNLQSDDGTNSARVLLKPDFAIVGIIDSIFGTISLEFDGSSGSTTMGGALTYLNLDENVQTFTVQALSGVLGDGIAAGLHTTIEWNDTAQTISLNPHGNYKLLIDDMAPSASLGSPTSFINFNDNASDITIDGNNVFNLASSLGAISSQWGDIGSTLNATTVNLDDTAQKVDMFTGGNPYLNISLGTKSAKQIALGDINHVSSLGDNLGTINFDIGEFNIWGVIGPGLGLASIIRSDSNGVLYLGDATLAANQTRIKIDDNNTEIRIEASAVTIPTTQFSIGGVGYAWPSSLLGAGSVLTDTGGGGLAWVTLASGGVTTIGTIDTNGASADGASILGTSLFMQSASVSVPGLVNTSTQSFFGAKSFTSGNFVVDPGGSRSITLGTSNGTGDITLGSSSSAQAINIANGSGASVVTIADNQAAGSFSLFKNATTATFSLGDGSMTGNATLFNGAGTQTISIAAGSGAKTLNLGGTHSTSVNITGVGATLTVGTGNYVADGTTNSTVTEWASLTTGTITIGGTAQTGNMTFGSSSGTNIVNIGNGAGATTVNISNSNTAGAINIGKALTTGTMDVGTGAMTGTANFFTGLGTQAINIGSGSGAKTITIGNINGATGIIERVGTGNFSLDGAAGSIYTIGASTTTGTITIGGTAQTGTMAISTGTGTQAINIATGAGAKTLTLGSTNTTSSFILNAGSTGSSINTSAATGQAVILNANSLSSGSALYISVVSTAATGNTQSGFTVQMGGANAASSQTTYGARIFNNNTGTTSTNIALQLQASGGTTNTALDVTGGSTFHTNLTFDDGVNLVTGTSTGMKIGTATTQKFGFFNATPVSQQAAATDLGTVLSNMGIRVAGTAYPITTSGAVNFTGGLTIATTNMTITDKDVALSATTGTKFGTATTQKLSFYNSTPIVQPANTVAIDTTLVNLGLRATGGNANFATAIVNNLPLRLKGYTVATLPAGTQGDTAFCTDLLTPAFLVAAVGGGAVVGPVFYNGTAWVAV